MKSGCNLASLAGELDHATGALGSAFAHVRSTASGWLAGGKDAP